jgi:hypothetical protein
MLLHLPIVILATLSPIAVSDTVPKFDIVRECSFEEETTVNFSQCSTDEAAALAQLKTLWTQFVVADKSTCIPEATIGGFASYVELLTCLQMARDVRARGRVAETRHRAGCHATS